MAKRTLGEVVARMIEIALNFPESVRSQNSRDPNYKEYCKCKEMLASYQSLMSESGDVAEDLMRLRSRVSRAEENIYRLKHHLGW